jgi:hypothetical protein
MRKSIKLASLFGFALVIAVTTARGQPSTITVDELGNGFYNGALLLSGPQPDPFNGGTPGFAYTLPFPYTYLPSPVADIHLFEPGPTPQQPSDLLRFTRDASGLNTLLFFYSDASVPGDPPDAPADVLALPNPVFLYTSFTEIGLFGNPYSEAGPNGVVYATANGVGWDGNPNGTQYTFISDAVVIPEPKASLLASLGGGCLLLGLRSLRTLRRK